MFKEISGLITFVKICTAFIKNYPSLEQLHLSADETEEEAYFDSIKKYKKHKILRKNHKFL